MPTDMPDIPSNPAQQEAFKKKCSSFTTPEGCRANGCYWYHNACHGIPEMIPPPPVGNKKITN